MFYYGLAKQNENIKVFLKALKELELEIKQGVDKNPNLVLSTIHGSKGLEYDRVMLVDVNSGILPCVEKPKKDKISSEYEEEIRLFYVAITRAKNKLEVLTYKNAYGEDVEQSPFVDEIFQNAKRELIEK